MLRTIRTEDIYDAIVDDEAFEQLGSRMAEAIGARSGVIHWRNPREETEEISYSGYFSPSHMASFERDFADSDLWSTAVRQSDNANRVWNCEQLVPAPTYEMSRIYNEWVRPMGDDTFRCLGGVIRTGAEAAELGFHRGRSQPAFDEDTVRAVNEGLVHLRRMISIRSKLVSVNRQRSAAMAATDVGMHAVLTLDAQGRLLNANSAAEELLSRGDGLMLRGQRLVAWLANDSNAMQVAFARAAAAAATEASALLVHRPEGAPYELSVASANKDGAGRHIIVVVTERGLPDFSLHARIRALYGLTPAEAEVAVRLADGASIARIADERRASISTVRTQLKSVAGKMRCNRQSELVGMINSLPRFRQPNTR